MNVTQGQNAEHDVRSKTEEVFTIGHGTRTIDAFTELLHAFKVDVLVDVRSQPWSKFAPQFGQALLQQSLREASVKYVFMGAELGGRPTGDEFYDVEGRVFYNKLAESSLFLQGIKTIKEKSADHRIAIMCSESDHNGCHRYLLVGEILHEQGITVRHIDSTGGLQDHKSVLGEKSDLLFDMEERPEWKSLRSVRPAQTDDV